MKKYAVIAMIGNYNNEGIECTVNDVELVKDSDDRAELNREYAFRATEYKAGGKWYSYSVMKRADARRTLKRYGKMG